MASPNNTSNIKKYTTVNGLTNNVVYKIVQDKQGFMWFATEDGLNRYDGHRFVGYRNDPTNKKTISQNFIQSIYCDAHGDIWVGTAESGLNRYNCRGDDFTIFRHKKDRYSINGNDIISIIPARDGNLWVASYRNGINYYDRRSGRFYDRKDILAACKSRGDYKVQSILEGRNGIFWVGTQGNGLYAYDLVNRKSTPIKGVNPAGLTVFSIGEDPTGHVWIGTNRGLLVVKDGVLQVVPNLKSIAGKEVFAIFCDRNQNMWIGTDKGAYIFKLRDVFRANAISVDYIGEGPSGLSYQSIRSISQDRDGNIWIGTYTGGVNFISSIPDKFRLIAKDTPGSALSYDKVWGMCEDKQGNLWVGTDGSGIDKFDANLNKLGSMRSNPSNTSSLSSNAILSAYCDRRGELWFGTFESGLNRVDPRSGKVTRFLKNGTSRSISDNTVRAIFEDSQGKLWVGTDAGGLCCYDPRSQNFAVYNTKNSGISENDVRSICEDARGNLWVGTYGEGLNLFDRARRHVAVFRNVQDDPSSLSSNRVQAMLVDSKGRLWVGTSSGLCRYSYETRNFKSFTEKEGLVNNNVMAILEDGKGNLWISTTRGISRFCIDKGKFENYDLHDGLQSGQFMPGSAIRCRGGRMLFGGTNGLNVFDPSRISSTQFEPEVLITDFQIYNAIVPIRSTENPKSPLLQSITLTSDVELSYRQNTLSFDFVALNYSFPEKTQYAYMMEGADEGWNKVGGKTSATYRNLGPGKYVFKVKATNQDGVWSKTVREIRITIRPPFWLTWWAYLFYAILIALAVRASLRLYTFRIRTLNKLEIARIEQQKSEEVHQAKLEFFTNISHEFRTPLTLIIGPLERFIAAEADPARRKLLDMMHRNANRLLRLVNQLMDLRKTERGEMKLKVQEMDLVAFLQEMTFSFEELSHQKHITLQLDAEEEHVLGWADPEFLDKILYNLLSNAYKFTSSGGRIVISVRRMSVYGQEHVRIGVEDTGKGMRPKELDRIFELFYQVPGVGSALQKGSGIGLHLTKMLVKLHKGEISVSSEEGRGTSFFVDLPLQKEAYAAAEVASEPVEKAVVTDLAERAIDIEPMPDEDVAKHVGRLYTVLVVEDDDDIRRYVKDELHNLYNVIEACNGEDGLKMAAEFQPDAIISDVMMPVLDGVEMCKQLKLDITTSHIPIILLTAKSSIEDRIEGLESGADSYIPKPFNPAHLKTRIAKLIELRELLKQKFSKSISFQPSEVVASSPDEEFLRKALALINENISNSDYNGDLLSKDLGMSRANLHRKLRSLLNQSSSEFIRNIRLKQAAILLKQNKLTIAEVGYEVGFSSPTYFSACFSNYFKMSPSEYVAKNAERK
ncbi:two-component regulator propeller domain-containing protein [uncultured Acetobacteroides sp.]|uniref:hybrid sensor histidine kinase/response regulator transcription factor n=1 Tax=uncultured Acetobacteroides sp. TaxID=1760811 RepID=UPI0029F505C2|nr:two-component regulator propeller domain-containing protein [uncultured Acetobacteroides sp.]